MRAALLSLLIAVSSFAVPAQSQTILEDTLLRPTTLVQKSNFGADLTALGDATGAVTFAIGAPQTEPDGSSGQVYVFSATNGVVQEEYVLNPSFSPSDARFGSVVQGVPDITGDGKMDLLVSATHEDVPDGLGGTTVEGGAVYVYNGATGAIIIKMIDPSVSMRFGETLGWVPDVTGDGVPDLLTGSRLHSTPSFNQLGRASVRNGATGQTVRYFNSPTADQDFNWFGAAVLGLDDLDGDGFGDVAISEPPRNKVHIFSGATGALIYTASHPDGDAAGQFGKSLARTTDRDGDGVRDFWVGAQFDNVPFPSGAEGAAGQVYLISGATGEEIMRLDRSDARGLDNVGRRVEMAGDVDGDGVEDLLIGRGDVNIGIVMQLYSGATGAPLFDIGDPMNSSLFADSYIHAGDLDGNGTPDFIIGDQTYEDTDAGDPFNSGAAFVYLAEAAEMQLAGTQGWRLLSAPLMGTSYESLLGPVWTQGFVGADLTSGGANVFTYDESVAGEKGEGWSAAASQASSPLPGQGIAYYAFTDDDQLAPGTQGGFPKTLSAGGLASSTQVAMPVTFTDTGALSDDGWNLLGNPFPGAIDWSAEGWEREGIDNVVYVYDAASSTYQTWNGTTGTLPDGTIEPFEGFWVKAFTDTNLGVSVAPEAQTPPSALATSPSVVFEASATLGSEVRTGKAAVMVHPDALDGHDTLDAYALTPFAPSYVSLHTLDTDGSRLDINALPPSDNELAIPLDVWAVDDGSFASANVTLRWPDLSDLPSDWAVSLLDTQTNTVTDLRQRDEYVFTIGSAGRVAGEAAPKAKAGPPTPTPLASSRSARRAGARFVLQISGQLSVDSEETPTVAVGIERVQPNPVAARGVLVVRAAEDGEARLSVFDTLGREIAVLHDGPLPTGRHEIAFETRELATGPYVVRWQSGTTVDTRTVTVIR